MFLLPAFLSAAIWRSRFYCLSLTLMLTDARKDYVRWCRTVGVTPVQLEVFDRELSGLIQRASLPIEHGPAGTINNGMASRRLLRAA
jgi:hypothetical protein